MKNRIPYIVAGDTQSTLLVAISERDHIPFVSSNNATAAAWLVIGKKYGLYDGNGFGKYTGSGNVGMKLPIDLEEAATRLEDMARTIRYINQLQQ